MMGAGVVTAALGYSLGREALKGITQPDLRPPTAAEARKKQHQETMMIVPEEQIVAQVSARISGKAAPAATPVAAPTPAQVTPTPPELAAGSPQMGLPVFSEIQGVKLEVRSVEKQGDLLILNVSLTNSGSRPVRFLYSFLSLTDNQGRSFSATTEGLPGELPPDGQTFTGTVSLASALLDGAETLTMSLNDYPDQQLELQLSGIPVIR